MTFTKLVVRCSVIQPARDAGAGLQDTLSLRVRPKSAATWVNIGMDEALGWGKHFLGSHGIQGRTPKDACVLAFAPPLKVGCRRSIYFCLSLSHVNFVGADSEGAVPARVQRLRVFGVQQEEHTPQRGRRGAGKGGQMGGRCPLFACAIVLFGSYNVSRSLFAASEHAVTYMHLLVCLLMCLFTYLLASKGLC